MDVCIYLPTCTQQFIYHLPFAFTEIWIGPQHIQATLYIFCCFPLSYYWCTRLFNNTNWTRPAPTRQRVRRQTWRFYPGGLNVKCIMLFIFYISSEGGNRIKERLSVCMSVSPSRFDLGSVSSNTSMQSDTQPARPPRTAYKSNAHSARHKLPLCTLTC